MDEPATTRDLIDRWCHTFSLGDYPLCKTLALEVLRRTESGGSEDEFLHGRKSIVQSLHFLGEHDAARTVALETWDRADRVIDSTMVHPRASMGIILARIACLQGDIRTSRTMAATAFSYATTADPISCCQVLALALAPIAFWLRDEAAARDAVARLAQTAQTNRFNYWIGWAANLEVALGLVFGPSHDGETGSIDFRRLDAKQADLLATLDDRLISDLAVRRVLNGQVGWTRSEVFRIQAVATSWFDPQEAALLLDRARAAAHDTGVVIWDERLRRTEAEFAARIPPTATDAHLRNRA